ncbi:MAG: hypothetical protein ACRD3T_08660 [Terriglobia bacterium]
MNQSATGVLRCRIDAAVSRVVQVDPTTPSTHKPTAKSAKYPIKMRVGTMWKDAKQGFYASKATEVIEKIGSDFGRYEQTHCEMGRNPVKMRVRVQRKQKKNSFFKDFHRLTVCNTLKTGQNQKSRAT